MPITLNQWQRELSAVFQDTRAHVTLAAAERGAGATTLAILLAAQNSEAAQRPFILTPHPSGVLSSARVLLEGRIEAILPHVQRIRLKLSPDTPITFNAWLQRLSETHSDFYDLILVDDAQSVDSGEKLALLIDRNPHTRFLIIGRPPVDKTHYRTPMIDLWWKAAWDGALDAGWNTYAGDLLTNAALRAKSVAGEE